MWAETLHRPRTQQALAKGRAGMDFQREGPPAGPFQLSRTPPSLAPQYRDHPGVRGWRSPLHLALSIWGPGAPLVFL